MSMFSFGVSLVPLHFDVVFHFVIPCQDFQSIP
jgi:hypothetical protein